MTTRLLRLLARHPLKSLGFALTLPLGLGALALARPGAPAKADDPNLLVERVWFDSYPEKPTDKFSLWLLFENGYGVYREGSGFRFLVDVVSYEQKGDKLAVTVLEENKKKETRYTIRACDDKPPFDICLIYDKAPLGPAKYYSFRDSDQLARTLPWVPARAELARSLPAPQK